MCYITTRTIIMNLCLSTKGKCGVCYDCVEVPAKLPRL